MEQSLTKVIKENLIRKQLLQRHLLQVGVIAGWSTALMKGYGGMKVGDQWELYIPYQLGYGKDGYSDIPGYSTLIFNVNLVGISPLKGTERSVDDVLVAE